MPADHVQDGRDDLDDLQHDPQRQQPDDGPGQGPGSAPVGVDPDPESHSSITL